MENKTLKEQKFKDLIISNLWRLFGMILLGVVLGYLVYRDSEKDNNPQVSYFFTILGICTLIGIIMFLVKVIPAYKKIKKPK